MEWDRDSPSSTNVPESSDHPSLKLRERAETQICCTGALGLMIFEGLIGSQPEFLFGHFASASRSAEAT